MADIVAKRFCPSDRARLIQVEARMRNIDSNTLPRRFYCCRFIFHRTFAATFATISAHLRHAGMSAPCLLCGENRTRCGARLRRQDRNGTTGRDNDGNSSANQLVQQFRHAFHLDAAETIIDHNILAFDESVVLEALSKCAAPLVGFNQPGTKKSNHRHRRLLRDRHQRPSRRSAQKRDELAATNHSITWSAIASNDGGTVRPSVLAVCRLMISSNLVGRMTRRSAGFSPLRMRPT